MCVSILSCCGCAVGRRREISDETTTQVQTEKIAVEAFSFDARLYRENKPTSFKLEIYSTDTLLGLSGRGYLGKGALRGRLDTDSLDIYFPASNEYVHESLVNLITRSECTFPINDLEIISLIKQRPDSLTENLNVEANYDDEKKPEFMITASGCVWSLKLIYDLRNDDWRIREFYFDNGSDLRLRGIRDKYKPDAKVKPIRFDPAPPPDAVVIHP